MQRYCHYNVCVCVCDVYMILAPEWLLHVITVSCRLTLNSLHLQICGIFIQHNTALKTVLELNPITDYTLRHLPLPDFDDDDGSSNNNNNNRTNRLCVQIQHKTTNKSKITLYFKAFLIEILNHFSTYTSSK